MLSLLALAFPTLPFPLPHQIVFELLQGLLQHLIKQIGRLP